MNLALSFPCTAADATLGQCIGDIYTWSLAIVGIIAFVQILFAGVMYLTAAGNASRISQAKSKIFKAILGIIILFSSYLILYTINPDLVKGSFKLIGIGGKEPEGAEYDNTLLDPEGELIRGDQILNENEPPFNLGIDIKKDQSVSQCSDNIDNDKDNKIDFPSDPDCTSVNDNSEEAAVVVGPDPSKVRNDSLLLTVFSGSSPDNPAITGGGISFDGSKNDAAVLGWEIMRINGGFVCGRFIGVGFHNTISDTPGLNVPEMTASTQSMTVRMITSQGYKDFTVYIRPDDTPCLDAPKCNAALNETFGVGIKTRHLTEDEKIACGVIPPSGQKQFKNEPPEIELISPQRQTVKSGDSVTLQARISDPENDKLEVRWQHIKIGASGGVSINISDSYSPETKIAQATFTAPNTPVLEIWLQVIADDKYPYRSGSGSDVRKNLYVEVK